MSTLDRLAGPGNVLGKEAPDAKEFDGLVRSGLARLKDAEKQENSLESRFDLAYGAAHALCLAALRHQGYRPSKRYINDRDSASARAIVETIDLQGVVVGSRTGSANFVRIPFEPLE